MTTTTTKDARAIRPLGDKLLVRREKAASVSKGGIHLPDTVKSQEKPQKGEVLACGPGRLDEQGRRLSMDVRPGEVVLFTAWAGNEVPGEDGLVILSVQDVLGVLEHH